MSSTELILFTPRDDFVWLLSFCCSWEHRDSSCLPPAGDCAHLEKRSGEAKEILSYTHFISHMFIPN